MRTDTDVVHGPLHIYVHLHLHALALAYTRIHTHVHTHYKEGTRGFGFEQCLIYEDFSARKEENIVYSVSRRDLLGS